MHGNLRFYYVQQPCLDYVLFLGFSEVISFSLSDISSGPDALRWRTGEARPPHFPSRSRLLKTCIPFSSHVHFSKSYPGGGWGRGSLFVQYGQNQVLIIVDMILSWKNILWFQRVSEHVLELRALWDVWVKGMHYSFWLCGDKKKKTFYTFYHSDAHESRLVLFISSYWLVCALVRCRVHWRSHPALCLLKREGGRATGEGLALVICFANDSTVKMCHVLKKEKTKSITYQPTVWSVVI